MQVKVLPFPHEDVQTAQVNDDQIYAYMDPHAVASHERRPDIEQRPVVECQHLMRHLFTDSLQHDRRIPVSLRAQVDDRHLVRRYVRQDSLVARRKNDGAQHILA